ncbi:MarR family winged helix-turn-helix transcriptional regulator [Hutsoniella sourekii]
MDLICYINIFYRFGKQLLEEMLEELGLDMMQLIAMLVIDQVPGISQSRLNQFLAMDKGNLSKFLGRMEDRSWIRRQEEATAKSCYLTPEGEALVPQLQEILTRWQDQCLAGVEDGEWQVFNQVSQQLSDNLMAGH